MFHLDQDAIEVFQGEIELDESSFGGARKGKRGIGAAGKVIVFDTKSSILMPVMSNKITPDSRVYLDHWHSYNALDVAGFSRYSINHSSHFADGQNLSMGLRTLETSSCMV